MNLAIDIKRESAFLLKQRSIIGALVALFLLSVFAVWSGLSEVQEQKQTIERLLQKDTADRQSVLQQQSDYGSAAYYLFHITYASPEPLAFAAIGQRDVFPWKHRIRMLALEGQIYETDSDNPELSLSGRFDFAFVVSILVPLFLIVLLHDLRSSERESGRYDLLTTTARSQRALWYTRVFVLSCTVTSVVLVPFLTAASLAQASLTSTLLFALTVVFNSVIWTTLIVWIVSLTSTANWSSARHAAAQLGIWILLTVIIPASGSTAVNLLVSSPTGGDILLTQREAVNDAWDLPPSATWDAFTETHPEWRGKTDMDSLFEWKWYYAFQQVGDQVAADLSLAYKQATLKKDHLANRIALASPPLLTQRFMTHIAQTDTQAMLAYEESVRRYHASLREFYYPLMFNDVEFNVNSFENLPIYQPNAKKESQ